MDDKVYEQAVNVATLPGIVGAPTRCPTRTGATAFRSAAWRRSMPTRAASCRPAASASTSPAACAACTPGCARRHPRRCRSELADALFAHIPAGVGSTGRDPPERARDGRHARPAARTGRSSAAGARATISSASRSTGRCSTPSRSRCREQAKKRQRDEMGTLGSGNHYLEVQEVAEVFDAAIAAAFGLAPGDIVVMIHCGSRGPRPPDRHRVPEARWSIAAAEPRHRRCPTASWPARRSTPTWARSTSARCARRSTARWPTGRSSRTWCARCSPRSCRRRSCRCCTTCRTTPARSRRTASTASRASCIVHRKGATRAFGPGHPDLPEPLRAAGQPVLIGGSMGTGVVRARRAPAESEALAFWSACHGAGPRDEPAPGAAHLDGRAGGRRARAAAASSCAARRRAASPRRRPAPTRTSPRWSTPRTRPAWRARWRGSSRWCASRGESLRASNQGGGRRRGRAGGSEHRPRPRTRRVRVLLIGADRPQRGGPPDSDHAARTSAMTSAAR